MARYISERVEPQDISFEEVQAARATLELCEERRRQIESIRQRFFLKEAQNKNLLAGLEATLPGQVVRYAFDEISRDELDAAYSEIEECRRTLQEAKIIRAGIVERRNQNGHMRYEAEQLVHKYESYHEGIFESMRGRLQAILDSGLKAAAEFYGPEKITAALRYSQHLCRSVEEDGLERAQLRYGSHAVNWALRIKSRLQEAVVKESERPQTDFAREKFGALLQWVGATEENQPCN